MDGDTMEMVRWLLHVVLVCGCGRFGFDATGDDAPTTDAGSDASEGGDPDAAMDIDAPGTMPQTFAAAYTNLPTTGSPTARRATGAAVANDQRIWIYGGFAGMAGIQSEIYAFTPSTNAWALVTPASGTPPTRERHALGWDSANNVLVAFSGYAGTFPNFTFHDELYFFVPNTGTWTQIPKAGTWPAARRDAVMFWVPSQNQFLVYGGNNGSGSANRFADLWTLSINTSNATATWTQLAPGGDPPPAQSAPCAGYDPTARRLIVFGGETSDGAAASTTYQYSLDSNSWKKDVPTGTIPSDRAFANCAWDLDAKRLVLYGGQASNGSPIGGAFVYNPDAKKWETLSTASGTTPGNCSDGGAAFSPAHGATFVFGGRTATITYSNDSLKLDLVPQ